MPISVAIVGAGLAGLTCANILAREGLTVTVFDKGRHTGGRLASRDRDEHVFDYGAQYFTVKDESFMQELSPLITQGKVAAWQGSFASKQDGPLIAKPSHHARYVGVPVMRSLALDLMDADINQSPAGPKVHLSHRVTRVTRDSHKKSWSVQGTQTDEGGEEEFRLKGYDHLVINTPPAQAMDLYAHPLLPDCFLQPCIALALSFDQRLDCDFDGITLDGPVLSWLARDSSKPGRPPGERWMLHASPQWSEQNWARQPGELQEEMANYLGTIFDTSKANVVYSKMHKWKYALPVTPLSQGCITEPDLGLTYCGDWCQGARVESAYLSGVAAASAILRDPR